MTLKMYETSPETAMDKLEKGRAYTFKARNFHLGVYDGNGGFIGIREKFYSIYPDTEYHCDPPWGGTVWAIEATDHMLPTNIEVREYFESRCSICQANTKFEPNIPFAKAPGRNYHIDPALDADHDPHSHTYLPTNVALVQWLSQFEEDEEYRDYILGYAGLRGEAREALITAFAEKRKAANEAFWAEREKS